MSANGVVLVVLFVGQRHVLCRMRRGVFYSFSVSSSFLSQYSLSDRITNTITLDSYMDTFYLLTLAMGVLFELPLLAWMLGRMGILKRGFSAARAAMP